MMGMNKPKIVVRTAGRSVILSECSIIAYQRDYPRLSRTDVIFAIAKAGPDESAIQAALARAGRCGGAD